MLVDGRERRETEPPSDFFETWGVAMLLNEFLEVVQDFSLTFRKWLHGSDPPEMGLLSGDYTQRKGENPLGGSSGICHTQVP